MRRTCAFLVVVSLFSASALRAQILPLIIHEWGTFTSLQDETGRAIGGINSDDEPLPQFVHRVRWDLIQTTPSLSQGVPRCFPDVTMRLETPVMYFHPPRGAAPFTVDVTATFRGGWLTEYYPDAVESPELNTLSRLVESTEGRLSWNYITVGAEGQLEKTPDHVWTTPRNVEAAYITSARGESEKFLFYRGVGHLDAPMSIHRDGDKLTIFPQLDRSMGVESLKIPRAWLYQKRDDGKCAFRAIQPMTITRDSQAAVAQTPANFAESDFAAANLDQLRHDMHEALVADGLFADEADALLGTWELSYFKSTGMRVLFLVPQVWTDHYLPVKVSVDSKISRTMVGRIDLVTPAQRSLLAEIGQSKDPATQDAAYQKLGRFRNGLILDERNRHPYPAIVQFVESRRLQPFGE